MADTLNLEQIHEFREAFNLFDLHGKGIIKVRDLGAVMTQLGLSLTKKKLQIMIDELDGDGNRAIDFPEFLVLLSREYNKKRIEYDVKNAFTNTEIEQIKDAMESVNGNKKRSVKINDLSSFLSLFNIEWSDKEVTDAANEFDNGENSVEFTQILIILARRLNRMSSEDELIEAFKFFDNDKDGLISTEDLKSSMSMLGESFSTSKLNEMIYEADSDGDGHLNVREFIAIMRPEAKYVKVTL